MAESATATPSAPVANTPAAAGGQGQDSGTGDTNSQTQQSQSTNQTQNQTNNNASSATTANNNSNSNSNDNGNNNSNDENQPPDQRPNRGLPYYEKLRRELRDTISKKRLMDKTMVRAKHAFSLKAGYSD